MKEYELTYLISSELSEEKAKEFQNKITSFVQEEGGVLAGENLLLKRSLAYPIKKETRAYLAVLNFQISPEKLAGLEKKLKLEKQIIRYLLLIKAKLKKIRAMRRKFIPKIAPEKEKKAELKEIEKKLEEILKE